MTTTLKIESEILGRDYIFTMPDDGGYMRAGDGQGDYPQLFKANGAAMTAENEEDFKRKARQCVSRWERDQEAHERDAAVYGPWGDPYPPTAS